MIYVFKYTVCLKYGINKIKHLEVKGSKIIQYLTREKVPPS